MSRSFLSMARGVPPAVAAGFKAEIEGLISRTAECVQRKCIGTPLMAIGLLEYCVGECADRALDTLGYNQSAAAPQLIALSQNMSTNAPFFPTGAALPATVSALVHAIEHDVRYFISVGQAQVVRNQLEMLNLQRDATESQPKKPRLSHRPGKENMTELDRKLLDSCIQQNNACIGYVYSLLDDSSKSLLSARVPCVGQACSHPRKFSHVSIRLPEGLKYKV